MIQSFSSESGTCLQEGFLSGKELFQESKLEIQMALWTFLVRKECWKMITLKVLPHVFGVNIMRGTYVKALISVYLCKKVIFI